MKRNTCADCGGTAAWRRAKLRATRRARLKSTDAALTPEEMEQARAHFAPLLPASMIEPVVAAGRAALRLRERIFSLQPGHLLTQSDVLDLRASWREAARAQEAVGHAEAASGQCVVAARFLGVVHNEGQPVDTPVVPCGCAADSPANLDADFEEA